MPKKILKQLYIPLEEIASLVLSQQIPRIGTKDVSRVCRMQKAYLNVKKVIANYSSEDLYVLSIWFLLQASCMHMMLTPHSWATPIICPILWRSASLCAGTGSVVGKTIVFWMRPTLTLRGDLTFSESAPKLYAFSSKFSSLAASLAFCFKSKILKPSKSPLTTLVSSSTWSIWATYGSSRPYKILKISFLSSSGKYLARVSSTLTNCFDILLQNANI